ncbi:hypothetical protein PKHYL_25390 [Psychrobacter sp. KH172YL61]|nr:hypothetical protein PKHYL_25390 [Psychrobacter sp. KH172YL61]
MAERLFEEGFISRVDRLEAQSALADAKSESVNANNDARLAMIALQRLLRTDYRIKPTTPLFVSSRPLPDVSYFQDLALNNHPGLQKVAAKRAQAQQLHALSDTGYKPTVLLYGYGQLEKTQAGSLVSLPVGSYGADWIKPRHWHQAMLKYVRQIFLRLKSATTCYCW